MKVLLGAALILVLVYLVAGQTLSTIVPVGSEDGEGRGKKLSYSPFLVTFKEQFLCYSIDHGSWVMQGSDDGGECNGPFIDSATLCRAMAAEGLDRVALYWEGRVLECN